MGQYLWLFKMAIYESQEKSSNYISGADFLFYNKKEVRNRSRQGD